MSDSSYWIKMVAAALLFVAPATAHSEDGHRLWLRYDPMQPQLRQHYAGAATEIIVHAKGAIILAAAAELERGLSGLIASRVAIRERVDRNGAVLLSLASDPDVQSLHLTTRNLGSEGFIL